MRAGDVDDIEAIGLSGTEARIRGRDEEVKEKAGEVTSQFRSTGRSAACSPLHMFMAEFSLSVLQPVIVLCGDKQAKRHSRVLCQLTSPSLFASTIMLSYQAHIRSAKPFWPDKVHGLLVQQHLGPGS